MEITVKIDGEFKTFHEDKMNFRTMMLAMDWAEMMSKQLEEYTQLIESSIDEDIETIAEIEENHDPRSDLEFSVELITSFFSEHFTYSDFVHGAYFNSVGEIYNMANDILELAYDRKEESEESAKKKARRGTLNYPNSLEKHTSS